MSCTKKTAERGWSAISSKSSRPTVAVDVDGVLHKYSQGWQDGTLYDEMIPGAMDGLQELWDAGCDIVLFTCRIVQWIDDPTTETYEVDQWRVEELLDWIDKYREPQHTFAIKRVTGIKPPDAVVFLDDRAVRFISWKQAIIDVKHHLPETCSSCLGEGFANWVCPECGHEAV